MKTLVIPSGRRAIPTALTEAEKQAIEANVLAAITTDLDRLTDSSLTTLIYWGDAANGGDDANSGADSSNRVLSFERVVELIPTYGSVQVYTAGTVIADYFSSMFNPPDRLQFTQGGGGKIIVRNSTNNASFPGGLRIRGNCIVHINDVDVELDSDKSASLGFIMLLQGEAAVTGSVDNSALTKTATNTICLFACYQGSRLGVDFIGTSIAAIAGKVFAFIALGADPNTTSSNRITSNITSA